MITYLQMEKIINRPYIDVELTMLLAEVGKNRARTLVNEIRSEMEAEGIPNFHGRRLLVPTYRMVRKLNISTEYVREQARQMRGGQNDQRERTI